MYAMELQWLWVYLVLAQLVVRQSLCWNLSLRTQWILYGKVPSSPWLWFSCRRQRLGNLELRALGEQVVHALIVWSSRILQSAYAPSELYVV